ncbi:MAG: hypothetical protein ACKO7G_07345 [Gammaproteobacteria bacterium]
MDFAMHPSRRLRRLSALALLTLATVAAPAMAQQWDMVAGGYHTHPVFHADRFELHLHDKATHRVIETTRGRYGAVPADLRYTAKMKPGVQPAQGAAGKPEKSGGHAHHH